MKGIEANYLVKANVASGERNTWSQIQYKTDSLKLTSQF
ncbi:hypothetical protein JCM19233_6343 [Vibrio astriarenae]|nr:hypothetical protein JCM19233_6343 [Vibrio sp. C7]